MTAPLFSSFQLLPSVDEDTESRSGSAKKMLLFVPLRRFVIITSSSSSSKVLLLFELGQSANFANRSNGTCFTH